ncbi:MAG: helix-turn-helix domain-containing protein [Bacteroidota bacterium]
MTYRELGVNGFLNNFIQCFWEYENTGAEIEHTILPDGFFDLIAEHERGNLLKIKLTGVWTKAIQVTIPTSTKIFGIRFKLIAAEYLFKEEIRSILDTSKILPSSFWGINTLPSDDFGKFADILSNQAMASIKRLKEIDSRKLKLFQHLYQDKNLSVEALSAQVCWSSRQINRYFNSQFGFPLKMFINIVRCNAAYPDIAKGKLCPQEEFFDQSHFIKEIKKYTGSTPAELHKNKNDRFLQLTATSPD